MEQLAIYNLGETNLQTTVTNGFCDYTNGKRPEEYLDELGPGFVCIPFEDACDLIDKACDDKYIQPWKEITEDEWDYFLGVLPPERYKTNYGVTMFNVSEYLTGNITQHCAHFNGKYYGANRRTSDNRDALAREVIAITA